MDGSRSIEEIALVCRLPEFVVLSFVYVALRNNAAQLTPPVVGARVIPGQSLTPWHETMLEIRDRLRRDRLFDALKLITAMRERHPDTVEVAEQAAHVEEEIEQHLAKGPLTPEAALEPATDLSELMKLECDPAEGFILSRINGVYTVDEVLRQLPSNPLHNLIILQNLRQPPAQPHHPPEPAPPRPHQDPRGERDETVSVSGEVVSRRLGGSPLRGRVRFARGDLVLPGASTRTFGRCCITPAGT